MNARQLIPLLTFMCLAADGRGAHLGWLGEDAADEQALSLGEILQAGTVVVAPPREVAGEAGSVALQIDTPRTVIADDVLREAFCNPSSMSALRSEGLDSGWRTRAF